MLASLELTAILLLLLPSVGIIGLHYHFRQQRNLDLRLKNIKEMENQPDQICIEVRSMKVDFTITIIIIIRQMPKHICEGQKDNRFLSLSPHLGPRD